MKNKNIKIKRSIRTRYQLIAVVKEWADRINVNPKQIRIQKMTRKWASCSRKKWISFNIDLLKEKKAFQEYVIIHELLHLQIPNHGKLFKSMMNVFLPGWRKFTENH